MNLILGRVVIDKTFTSNKYVGDKNINLVEMVDEYVNNSEKPTLIVGWRNVQKIFGNKVSILNKVIEPNIFWTFSPTEKIQHFNEDMVKFIKILYDDFITKFQYISIDPIIYKIKTVDDILNLLEGGDFDSTYINDDFIYIFSKKNGVIIGLDLIYYESIGIKIEKMVEIIKTKSGILLIEDYLETGIYQKYKTLFNHELDKKYIPVLEMELAQ